MANSINLKRINDIRKLAFFIPSYQRGYRWDEKQVTNLLDDIYDFMQNRNSDFYCLQPIVVKELENEVDSDRNLYEVIDGQQRLTTIKIILSYLGKINYPVTYKTRPDSEAFLNKLEEVKDTKNIDYYFFKKAYDTIKDWFESHRVDGDTLEDEFHIALGKYVQVIWYEVDPAIEVREVFTRLNIGKIALTNAELIKAFLLTENKENQLQWANEWDVMERKLRNERLWYFINPKKTYSSHIELLFDIYTGNTRNEKHDPFATFYEIQKVEDLQELWRKIKAYLALFEEWFEDRELYHYIGFLTQRKSILDIIELYDSDQIVDKHAFRDKLKRQIFEQVKDIELSELHYRQDRERIKNVLLLFNIATTLSQKNHESRFPFDMYVKEGKWSIEHIHAQNTEGIRTKEQWLTWIEESIRLFKQLDEPSNQPIIDKLKTQMNNQDLTESEFEELFNDVIEVAGDRFGEDLDTIDNLALLDQGTNSALGNHFYPVKYRKLIERDKSGHFIPICTRNVFMKYYSQKVDHFQLWSDSDRKDYVDAIKQSFMVFQ